MNAELAGANVTRAYSLGATSIAIFTFTLFFLFPRFASGEVSPFLFQLTLIVLGLATFGLVFASLHYYGASLGARMSEAERAVFFRRGDRFWLFGYTLLFLDPSLILFTIRLSVVGTVWLALWLSYVLFVIRHFPLLRAAPGSIASPGAEPVELHAPL